jgi:outer membrane putative beta-barrel porin/alpha-amylase
MMPKLVLCLTCALMVLGTLPMAAQNICSSASKANTLYCAPILSVENLNFVPLQSFTAGVPPAFSALNSAIGTQITQLPMPSPASGFVFSFGPGGLTRERDLGPIFSGRAETIGKHKLYLAFTYQHFQFDQIDNVSLKSIPLQLSGCNFPVTTGCGPFVETRTRLDLKLNEYTSYATFGLTSRIDLSVAIPILALRMGIQTTCSVCVQNQSDVSLLAFITSSTTASSSGIGDVLLRVKGLAWKGERTSLAVGTDVRFASGDALNFRGSGTTGVRPFAAFSYRARLSPHANIGYQWNGNSILAGNAVSSTTPEVSQHLPNSLTYAAGADLRIVNSVSTTVDLLGVTFFNAERVLLGSRAPLDHPDTACSVTASGVCQLQNFDTNSLAVGVKYNAVANLLISANVLFKLDNNGLHYKPSPMIGLSYTF